MSEFFTLLAAFLMGLAVGFRLGVVRGKYRAYEDVENFLDAEQAKKAESHPAWTQ
jgi:hypothetical protein